MAALFKRKKSGKPKDGNASNRKEKSRTSDTSAASHFFETSIWIERGLFILFSALVVTIGFLGEEPKGPRVILNQTAPTRIVAEFPFSYESAVEAEKASAAIRAQVPPVFQRSFEPFEKFRNFTTDLNTSIAKTQIDFEAEGEEILTEALATTASEVIERSKLGIEPDSITRLTAKTMPNERSDLIEGALSVLRSIYENGVYSASQTDTDRPQVTVIQLVDEEGRANLPNARSMEDARVTLRVRLNALSPDSETARLLFDIFGAGLQPNLFYSEGGTQRAIDRAIAKIELKILEFEEGDTLIDPDKIVSEADMERLNAYRAAELKQGSRSLVLNELFLGRLTLTVLMLIAVYIYLSKGMQQLHKRNRAIAITAVSILLNLLLIRAVIEVGDSDIILSRPTLSMLPFIAPYALAPILVAVLVGAAPAVLSALIIAVVFGIIQGNSIEFLLVAFISGVVGSFSATSIRKRSQLVRAGLLAGATAAIAGAAIALLNGFSAGLVGQQTIIALVVGLLTGILAVGLLPIFEQLFKITTEITLLELTDFNHPLLRQMQLEAPGTYHHSLMVANLSENAAAEIGASPLLCRVCSFFHDIGKLVKPEYFVENQRDGVNPHDEKNPSMSALVIKAHVKEGVELARKHKLPRVITDVIRQHHGTSLIQFFYYQAQQREKRADTHQPFPKKPDDIHVDESTYRYDGPRPAFKESAIIFFADGIEAASRSLKKVTQPNIEELIDKMFQSRIEDGQLDECPLTFQELDKIRKSFIYTLLNMLHARVEYPKEEQGADTPENAKIQSEDNEPSQSGNQQPI
ncbi:MAG: HDIG domain-containing metalloprotein [Verrucomicrobiota bacterium]